MKKILLSICFLSLNTIFSQTLETENYDALTVGNLSTNINGGSAGQGGNYLYATGGAVTDAQIFNEGGSRANVLLVNGSNANLTKYVYKTGLAASWGARTTGNNIVDVEYEFFTGASTTSKNNHEIRIFDAANTVAGITFAADTKIIRGLAYYNNSGTLNTYAFGLGASAATPIVLPASTWVKVGCSFNKTTGEVKWKGPGFDSFVMGASTATDIAEIDFLVTGGGTTNTASSTAKFDNYSAVAKATSNLLGVNENIVNKFSIYPNPTNDIVTISKNNSLEISAVSITDINGRVVKEIVSNEISTINVADLNAGVYFLKVTTAEGVGTTKLIKN